MIVRMFNEIKEIQKALRIQSTQDQKKKNFSGHIIIKTLGI
jgi:hypothetical protein